LRIVPAVEGAEPLARGILDGVTLQLLIDIVISSSRSHGIGVSRPNAGKKLRRLIDE
jgi:hypothetical protein